VNLTTSIPLLNELEKCKHWSQAVVLGHTEPWRQGCLPRLFVQSQGAFFYRPVHTGHLEVMCLSAVITGEVVSLLSINWLFMHPSIISKKIKPGTFCDLSIKVTQEKKFIDFLMPISFKLCSWIISRVLGRLSSHRSI
jgi:hypothetical protein